MVDENKMALRHAVEISYLPKDLQQELYDSMHEEQCTPSFVQAVKMRKLLAEDKLTPEVIYSILQGGETKPERKNRTPRRQGEETYQVCI